MGISENINEVQIEIREKGFRALNPGSGYRYQARKSIRQERINHGSWRCRNVHQRDSVESAESGEGTEARGRANTRALKIICREVMCFFNCGLSLPISCLNNSQVFWPEAKSSVWGLVHAEVF